jgi:hypothetical protein|tara:strand:+ start:1386 stop:1733 length:348 start_codon:yes stop_codon:yes gene_type:complete
MATKVNISIDQGSDFSTSLVATSAAGNTLNLSGYNARAKIRYAYSTGQVTDFTAAVNSGSAGEGFVSGLVDLSLTSTQTTGLIISDQVYDVEVYSGDYVVRVQQGIASVSPEVTY